ncbi:MAG: sodium ABC transporter ATP-binding protein [Firmicutes bacterium HGW-Firmicutes-14]|nr:MAG: sodium ABC transporter ATP-binding protein [Firmicutes bacterium HGW-Firmicutes-14]
MIKAEGLTKTIGHKQILRGIDLHIPEGRFVTVFGPNGAGKSTLLKTLALISKPTSGNILINGLDIRKNADVIRQQIGVISHQTFLYDNLTARENLSFYGQMYRVPQLKDRIFDVLSEVGLEISLNEPVRTFSRGMQQRLAIARAILHDPALLFLDEPYTGLDPHAIQILNSVLRRLNLDRRTVFLITHNFEEGFEMSDRVLFVVKGRIVYDGQKQELKKDELRNLYLRKVEGAA